MITKYFEVKGPTTSPPPPIIHEYFELHRSFVRRNTFKSIYDEIKYKIIQNSSRESCVCVSSDEFLTHKMLPKIEWTQTLDTIRNTLFSKKYLSDYGLVHYYKDETAPIHWHSDRDGLRTPIYIINVGGTRIFCLKNKINKKIHSFDLHDGDLFVMKIGCQEKYVHCIKSIKAFSAPRISITFHQLEPIMCYFAYNSTNHVIFTTDTFNATTMLKVATLAHGIVLVKILHKNNDEYDIPHYMKNTENLSILKSNLQKAIRRKEKMIALSTAMKMITNGTIIELLRRLSIITIEDVVINKYFPIIVWYFAALSSNKSEIVLTNKDVVFIYSYVGLLCDTDEISHNNIDTEIRPFLLCDIWTNVYSISSYIRIQYGGFSVEIELLNKIISLDNNLTICEDNMKMLEPFSSEIEILDSAIDFHCFPKMPSKILSKIDKMHNFTESQIREYIWVFDSNINCRIQNTSMLDVNIWKTIIEPKCHCYRNCIRSILIL